MFTWLVNLLYWSRLGLLLDVLRLCITLFDYGGKAQKSSQFPATPGPKAQQDAKAKLEEFLLGNKGAAREMKLRKSMLGNTPAVINMIKLFDWKVSSHGIQKKILQVYNMITSISSTSPPPLEKKTHLLDCI